MIEKDIRNFIAQDLLFVDDISDMAGDQSMLQAGMIDSTGVLELVAFLESHFDITVADADVVPENLDTIDALAAFVTRKKGLAAAA
ncbi:acyl carrier protein [Rhodoblastus acidophilus]|uniref:acyl carrier protein n=1 Tax=Rhodoblastus acidophilus TaxID=1074 RepID=UPI0022242573|nr:acyl carrier protein [Rhodoblastus acidophilus]MCW2285940.1 acyl carrier protein [Rhodoblastus acidophilus]MCW2334834.1 acyl carrier protein [Rhodoblastus acidophilus]